MASHEKTSITFDLRSFLSGVGSGRSIRVHSPGETIFSQGDAANAVFYVQKGKVQATVLSKIGKEAVLAILGAGNFFGECCLTGRILRLSTMTAITECSLLRIEKGTMIQVLHNEPKMSERFMAYVLSRNNKLEEDLVDQMFNSSEKRLARALLLLANFGKDNEPDVAIAPISQETLASMIGTTRSRVNGFMNNFRRLGFIDYNGHLRVHKSLLNVVLHD